MSKSNLSVGTKAWADRINAAWRESAASFIEAGRLLIECKKTVPHGAFKTMLSSGELDFEERTAQRLMVIGADTRSDNPSILSLLPPSYTTLYDLTKLQDDEFERALSSGTINPKMHGSDVPKKRKESPVGGAVSATAGSENPPLATDALGTPLDDAEGGDSVVTSQDAERDRSMNLSENPGRPVDDAADDQAGGSGETDSRLPLGAQGKGTPQTPRRDGGRDRTHPDGSVTLHVGRDPISRLVNGMALILGAARELSPEDAVEEYPEDMRLSPDDLAYVTSWMLAFEDADRARLGVNEAAQ